MDPVGGYCASSSPNRQSEPPAGRSATINSPPRHASSTSLASPSRASDVDHMRQVAGITSPAGSPTSTVCRFPGLELGRSTCDIRGMDLGTCEPSSTYRHQVVGTPPIDILQESSELLAQWAQLMPDEAFERFQLDDLDSLLFDCSGVMDLPSQLQFANSSASGTRENSETMSSSGHSIADLVIRGDQIAVTTSSGSVTTSTVRSAGKRKCREGAEAAGDHHDGVEPPNSQQEHSIDTPAQQKQIVRGPKRPDKSTRYAIQTRSDVDIVDDGYRWRKYGQKPVKNSAHPRNYYRCTTPNCPVRKQVERCTENPRNVLTTYDGTHNHPGKPSHSARESFPPANARGNAEEITLTSSAPGSTTPISHHDDLLGPGRLPIPSNYIPPNLLDHMLTSAFFESGGWPNPAPQLAGASVSQRNIDLFKIYQLLMLQYQTQYPLLTNMFNVVMPNYSLPRPSLLDPRLALQVAQNYGMRSRSGQANSESTSWPPTSAFDQQASRSAPLSRAHQRLLRMQKLMGEEMSSERKSQQASEPLMEHHEGVFNRTP